MRAKRLLMTVGVALTTIPGGVAAIPPCDVYQCVEYAGCSSIIQQTECDNGTAQIRCYWSGCQYSGPSAWTSCYCGGPGGGCFLAGTPITMADGSTKAIETIEPGERVLGYDAFTSATAPSTVVSVHAPRIVDHYLVFNEHIRMSATQPVLSGGRWVDAGDLVIGDVLTAQDGVATPIFSARKVEAKVTV